MILQALVRNPIHGFTTLLLVVAVFSAGGCRDDAAAPTDTFSIGQPLGSPLDTMNALQWSLDNHAPAGWRDALDPSFTYVPDPAAATRYPTAFDVWDHDAEAAFVETLFTADLEFTARMVGADFTPPPLDGATCVWTACPYTLQVAGPGGASPVAYSGVAKLEFRLAGAFWYLTRWEDLHGGTAPWNPQVVLPTLGELRGAFASPPPAR